MSEAPFMAIFRATIDIEPVPKGRPRFGRGRVYSPKETVAFEEEVARQVQAAGGAPNDTDYLAAKVHFHCGGQKHKDIDNLQKSLFDAINAAGNVWGDDKQLTRVEAELSYDADEPRIEIEVDVRGPMALSLNARSRAKKKAPARPLPAGFSLCQECGKRAVANVTETICWACRK